MLVIHWLWIVWFEDFWFIDCRACTYVLFYLVCNYIITLVYCCILHIIIQISGGVELCAANLDFMFVVWRDPSHVAICRLFDALPEQNEKKSIKKCKNIEKWKKNPCILFYYYTCIILHNQTEYRPLANCGKITSTVIIRWMFRLPAFCIWVLT